MLWEYHISIFSYIHVFIQIYVYKLYLNITYTLLHVIYYMHIRKRQKEKKGDLKMLNSRN